MSTTLSNVGLPRENQTYIFHSFFSLLFQTTLQEPCPGGTYAGSNPIHLAIENYYIASSPVTQILAEYFKVLFPNAYKKFKAAFNAGQWVKGDPGPWLGRALIFKLQGSLHVDDKDEGPSLLPLWTLQGWPQDCAPMAHQIQVSFFSFSLFLRYKLICWFLSYTKGHVCFFESADVWHYVTRFTFPTYESAHHNTTPGRIGSVFFSPQLSLKHFEGKPKGWADDTKFGRHALPLL